MPWQPTLPPYTCPLIDAVIKRIEAALEHISSAERSYSDDVDNVTDAVAESNMLLSALSDIECELSCLESRMEEIRGANAKLRECAEYWEEEAGTLERDRLNFEAQVDDLRSENQQLKTELSSMRSTEC